ncbi:hemolysin III family protein [Candidatus Latescibacterota bacterium]
MTHDTDCMPESNSAKKYTRGEEIANSITHGIGALLSISGLVVLVVLAAFAGDALRIVSFSIYGSTLILMYLASTVYHSCSAPRLKRILRIVDHSNIYLLIAGTYTPFMLVSVRGGWGWSIFGVIWGLALTGIIINVFFFGKARKLSLAAYVLMGWLCVIALREMISALQPAGMIWLAAGGLFYTFGVVFYVWKSLPYNHAVWHLFVLSGSLCHFFAIFFYVLPHV